MISENLDDSSLPNFLDSILSDCGPCLKELRKNRCLVPFLRGAKQVAPFFKKDVRQDRQPRYIDPVLHDILGKYTKTIFGWDMRREGVFTGDISTAWDFARGGKVFAIFPIGKFKYIWSSDITRLYRLYDEASIAADNIYAEKKTLSAYMEKAEDGDDHAIEFFELVKIIKNIISKYQRNSINTSLPKFECVLKCNSFYGLEYTSKTENAIAEIIANYK
jgi:hypothetical protein